MINYMHTEFLEVLSEFIPYVVEQQRLNELDAYERTSKLSLKGKESVFLATPNRPLTHHSSSVEEISDANDDDEVDYDDDYEKDSFIDDEFDNQLEDLEPKARSVHTQQAVKQVFDNPAKLSLKKPKPSTENPADWAFPLLIGKRYQSESIALELIKLTTHVMLLQGEELQKVVHSMHSYLLKLIGVPEFSPQA